MTLHDSDDLDQFVTHPAHDPVSALDYLAYVITAKLGYLAAGEGQRCGVLCKSCELLGPAARSFGLVEGDVVRDLAEVADRFR